MLYALNTPQVHTKFPAKQRIHPIMRGCVAYPNMLSFYSKKLLVSRPTSRLQNHRRSALHDWLIRLIHNHPSYLGAISSSINLRAYHAVTYFTCKT
jgi:hypothetical protein